nr:MAG TPA: hypothetical protein [Caudoviricetes sp.]
MPALLCEFATNAPSWCLPAAERKISPSFTSQQTT